MTFVYLQGYQMKFEKKGRTKCLFRNKFRFLRVCAKVCPSVFFSDKKMCILLKKMQFCVCFLKIFRPSKRVASALVNGGGHWILCRLVSLSNFEVNFFIVLWINLQNDSKISNNCSVKTRLPYEIFF